MTGEIVIPDKEKIWLAIANLVVDNRRFIEILTRLISRPNWDALGEARHTFDVMVEKLNALAQLIDPTETNKVIHLRPNRGDA